MKAHRNQAARALRLRRGMTLLEVSIGAVLLTIALASTTLLARSSQRAYGTGFSTATLESQVSQTIERVLEELRVAGLETLAPDPVSPLGATSIQYRQALDYVGGEVVWSEPRRLAFVYELGELDDGLDNNGNGLVDEGMLVLTEAVGTAAERDIVLTHWVRELQVGESSNGMDDDGNGLIDERGFFVVRNGETLDVRLTLERIGSEGFRFQRAAITSTRLRN